MFEAVTDTALTELDAEQLLRTLLERVRELLDVDTVTVLLLDDVGERLVAHASVGLEAEVGQGVRIPVGEGFAGRVAAERNPIMLDRVDDGTVLSPLLRDAGLRVLLAAPMLASDELIGVLHVGSRSERAFSDDDMHALQVVADRIALATRAQRSSAERAAASALHRSLLPARLPHVPGFQFAARYAPGARTGVGGDWYDVFVLPTGRVGIVMGDVVGHGLSSAVVMGRLRSALRAYALDCDDPGEVLTKLDRKAVHFEAGAMTTVSYGVLDPSTRLLQLSLAGHLPPIMAVRDAPARSLDVPVDPPIGVATTLGDRHSEGLSIPDDATLCFYTDGLIERRRRPLDNGLALVRRAVTTGAPEQVCASIMATCLGEDLAEDDVALLVMSHARRDGTGQGS